MITVDALLHYTTLGLIFTLPSLTIALGQGTAGRTTLEAIDTQPQAAPDLRKTFFLGVAINETAAILNGLIVLLLFFSSRTISVATSLAQLGIFFALSIPSICIGILASLPHQAAMSATARQPFFAKNISRLLLITLSIMQTSSILGFIISLIIRAKLSGISTTAEGLQMLASGIALGIGTIGPLIGLGLFAQMACTVIGMNRDIFPKIFTFTFISQALIETPILFALAISLIIVTQPSFSAVSCLAAALAISTSTFGPGLSSGRIARATCVAIEQQPDHYATISRTCMLAQTLIDTSAIYGLIIAIALLFFL